MRLKQLNTAKAPPVPLCVQVSASQQASTSSAVSGGGQSKVRALMARIAVESVLKIATHQTANETAGVDSASAASDSESDLADTGGGAGMSKGRGSRLMKTKKNMKKT